MITVKRIEKGKKRLVPQCSGRVTKPISQDFPACQYEQTKLAIQMGHSYAEPDNCGTRKKKEAKVETGAKNKYLDVSII